VARRLELTEHVPWGDLSERYGPWQICAERFRRGQANGIWQRLLAHARTDSVAVGEVDLVVETALDGHSGVWDVAWLAQLPSVIRIASGRHAADTAPAATLSGARSLIHQQLSVDRPASAGSLMAPRAARRSGECRIGSHRSDTGIRDAAR
jgi:transposase